MDGVIGRVPPEVEAVVKSIATNPNHAEAALVLAAIANRATALLHQVARSEMGARKGQPDWGRWASLTNVSRDAVLRTATCRQAAAQLLQADRPGAQPGGATK
jgi:hypothetical protein